ncbi:MAG TPA: type II toxin-antitoxin system HipA family toxin, partial [Burkholderiaceae bacterium]
MATTPRSQKTELEIGIGKDGLPVGRLTHVKDGAREYSSFSYDERWLASATRFGVSPDLALAPGRQIRKPANRDDACLFGALADTAPQAWGRRVVTRTQAAARQLAPALKAPTELDQLCAVDDFSRVGALRVRRADGGFLRTVEQGVQATAPFDALERLFEACRAVERGTESSADLIRLQGAGTSLGGSRPKCSLLDQDGTLVLAKFASLKDDCSVPRGELL